MGGKKKSSRGGKEDDDSERMEIEGDDNEEGDEEEEVILDDMDANDWARVVTDLVDDMRHVPANRILLCADPLGAVHQSQELLEREKDEGGDGKNKGADTTSSTAFAAAIEYRKIYEEFWYILGHVALTEGGMASSSGGNDFSRVDEDDDDGDGEEAPIVRLDAELVRTIALRVVELSPVGQPDVRAAATLAALGMAHATLDRSVTLTRKMDVAARQYAAAKKATGGGGKKAEALKVRMESLKRTVEDLDEVVLGPVIQGLFVHRYRDSNEHIRTMCISSLSRMALQRPDIFLTDKYTKYFGWMMHDKDHRVRCASLEGLHLPFKAVSDLAEGKARLAGNENLMIEKIELTRLEQVVAKFLPRIVDSVLDPVGTVQVVAMNLMLALLKGGFLDDVNDDKLWDQTNQRSLANDAPPNARKNALYFILEQLEAFDDGGENEKAAPNERKRAQQLDAIASYAAHTLTNGPVPIDKIHVETADLLVKSLREMPEHRGLVTDWGAMLRAIKDDNVAATATLITAGDRANLAKQRVLVRMLACAAREEVGSVADHEFLSRGTDAHAMEVTTTFKSKGKKAVTVGREHENLSIALLKALPNLLIQFKGDLAIIPELVSLPQFLIPTVFSLPQRKQDFMDLIKNLGEIYLSSSDTRILDNTARSLVSLCNGDRARAAESKAQLRKVVVELRDRVVDLMTSGDDGTTIATSAISVSDFTSVARSRRSSGRKKVPAGSPSSDKTSLTDDDTKGTSDADAEYSIFLNLKRLKILSKKCDLSVFFDDRNNVNQLEMLCNYITIGLKSRLRACKPVDLRLNADEETTVHKLIDNPNVLAACGKSVGEGLEFLLCVLGWFVKSVQESENLIMDEHDIIDNVIEEDEEEDKSVEDHVVIRLRDGLMTILELCFAQFIPSSYDHGDGESTAVQHSEEQHAFSDYVQLAAGKTTSDLRTLFPKEYADAASPILRSFALQDDGRLIGANVRFLDSKEYLLRDSGDAGASVAEMKLSHSLLYPLGRAIATNWTNGNRREAGVFLRHIGGSGPTAAEIVTTTSRQMKKIDPVRMLESQMASLRQSYEYWVDATPELETDFPSEEEMAMFEDEEKTHKEQFAKLEHRASQFSQTLGVFGKLGSPTLGPALRGFIREGIRFSFSNLDENGEDSLVLGSRLSFLLLLAKYASWAKKDKKHKSEISDYVDGLESDMRNHPEFDEVHADDLESLATFRNIMGLKALSLKSSNASVVSGRSNVTDGEESDESLDNVSDLPSPVPSTGSKSTRASRSSRLSSMLPTLPEADKEESPESPQHGDSDSDTHFSATSPRNSPEKSRSQSQMTYEHSGDESDVSSIPPVKTKVRQTKKRKN
jgi:cohesin complex subunit SA-1/2